MTVDPTLADAIDDACLRLDRYLRRAHAIAKAKHIRSLAEHNRDCCRAWGVERQALLDARAEAAELGRLLRDLVEVVNASALQPVQDRDQAHGDQQTRHDHRP